MRVGWQARWCWWRWRVGGSGSPGGVGGSGGVGGVVAVRQAVVTGNTIHNIAAAHPIEIALPQTGLVARRAAIHLLTAKPAPDSRSAGRVAICPATAPDPAWAVGAAERAFRTGPAEVLATDQPAAERIASEAGMSRAAVAEAGMLSEAVPGATTDRAPAAAAAAAPPAWDLEAAGAEASVGVAAVAAGAGRRRDIVERSHRSYKMKSRSASGNLFRGLWIIAVAAWACLCASTVSLAQPPRRRTLRQLPPRHLRGAKV